MPSTALADAAPYAPTLTAEIHAKLVRAFRLGATTAIAAGSCRVSPRTFREWIARGRADLAEGRAETAYARLALECDEARHKGDVELLAAVRSQATGRACRTCQGQGAIPASHNGGRADDRSLTRCPACRGKGYARAPDGKLALELLGRRHVADYGRKVDQRIEITGAGGGPVQIDTRSAAVLLDGGGLAAMSVEQLAALGYGGTAAPPPIASTTRGALPPPRSRDVVDAVEPESPPAEAAPAPRRALTFAGLGAASAE